MNEKLRGLAGGLQEVLLWLYGFMMGGILLICLFLSHINFARKELTLGFFPAILLLPMGVGLVLGFAPFCERLSMLQRGKLLLLAASIAVFLLQVFAAYHYWFYTAWDVPSVTNLADAVVHGKDFSKLYWYYSQFPNNLLLAGIFTVIRGAAHLLGLHDYEYFVLICVMCLLNSLTGLLLAFVAQRLFHKKSLTVLSYALYLCLLGISPWVIVPYSDSTGLPLPLAILALYVYRDSFRRRWIPYFGMGFLALAGYGIKPQIFIAFIAVMLTELHRLLGGGALRKIWRPTLRSCAALALGMCLWTCCFKVASHALHVPVDREGTFGPAHFFMMGLNTETMGAYFTDDNFYSASYHTRAERDRADMRLAFERIREMGPVGVGKQMVRKTLTNYYDGTFCWSGEGSFFSVMNPPKDSPFTRFFRGLYYTKEYAEEGIYYPLWSNFAQMIWLTVLFLSIFSVFGERSPEKNALLLSIIGLTLFELLFEARARYLYTYVPVYILLAVSGFQWLYHRLNRPKSQAQEDAPPVEEPEPVLLPE